MNTRPVSRSRRAFTLIELLVVISIIGVLMAMLFPAVGGAINSAKKAQAKNDTVQIANAVSNYELEYGRMPGTGTSESAQDVSGNVLSALLGAETNFNTRKVVFLEAPQAKMGKSGVTNNQYVDPWHSGRGGGVYKIALDMDYNNRISNSVPKLVGSGNEDVVVMRKAMVWSVNTNTKLQVRSWE